MARFPYQFEKWEFSFAIGWLSVFAHLCVDFDRVHSSIPVLLRLDLKFSEHGQK